jgi:hypothetical protein
MLSLKDTLFLDDSRLDEFDSYREEQEFLSEIRLLKEESKAQGAVKKADGVAATLMKAIKSLYRTGDDHLVEGTMELSKIITRFAVLATGVAVFPAGAFVSALVGAIGHFTLRAIRQGNDAKNREKLLRMYKSKLEFIEDKIGRTEKDDQKEQLIKIKHKLKSDIDKLEASVIKNK